MSAMTDHHFIYLGVLKVLKREYSIFTMNLNFKAVYSKTKWRSLDDLSTSEYT